MTTDKLPSQAQSTISISSTVRDLSDAKVAEANLNQQQKVDGEQDQNASDKLPSRSQTVTQAVRLQGRASTRSAGLTSLRFTFERRQRTVTFRFAMLALFREANPQEFA